MEEFLERGKALLYLVWLFLTRVDIKGSRKSWDSDV
jgi:hypothetical protein